MMKHVYQNDFFFNNVKFTGTKLILPSYSQVDFRQTRKVWQRLV